MMAECGGCLSGRVSFLKPPPKKQKKRKKRNSIGNRFTSGYLFFFKEERKGFESYSEVLVQARGKFPFQISLRKFRKIRFKVKNVKCLRH